MFFLQDLQGDLLSDVSQAPIGIEFEGGFQLVALRQKGFLEQEIGYDASFDVGGLTAVESIGDDSFQLVEVVFPCIALQQADRFWLDS